MTRILPVLALLLAASTAHAEEPTEPGAGYIADRCAATYPGDLEAAKACNVTISELGRYQVLEVQVDHESEIDILFQVTFEQKKAIEALQARIERLESLVEQEQAPARRSSSCLDQKAQLNVLRCEDPLEYSLPEYRDECRRELTGIQAEMTRLGCTD